MDQSLRQFVWRRAENTYEYCRVPQQFDALPFQVDHIIAEKHHGPTTEENLALSCYGDNAYKGPNIAMGKILGSKSRVSEILNGQRSLTLDMIRRLHAVWGIPAESLIQPSTRKRGTKRTAPKAA